MARKFCEVEDVVLFTGIQPKSLRIKSDDPDREVKMNSIIEKWIIQCSDLIISYCHNQFTRGVPPSVENVCLRMVANMIALFIARKDTPIQKVNDWSVKILDSEIFSQDLRDDLEEFKIDHSNNSDSIDFFAITGDGPQW